MTCSWHKQRGFVLPSLSMGTWALIALALVAALALARMHWIQEGREQILRENTAAAVRIVREQGAVTERVVTKYVKVQGETKTKIEYRDREVIKYVQANLDQFPLSNAFVSLHDAAAANTVPDSASAVDGTPSAVKAAQALPTITENYSICQQTADRLRSLQEWVQAQQKVGRE